MILPVGPVESVPTNKRPRDGSTSGGLAREAAPPMHDESIPYGDCQCGCGERTKIAPQTSTRLGWVRGEPIRFVNGHQARVRPSRPRPVPGPPYEIDARTGAVRLPLRAQDKTALAYAQVDPDNVHLAQYRWHLTKQGYAARRTTASTRRDRLIVLLHREVLGLAHGDGLQGDHINRDKLDCRRANLRITDATGNAQNRGSLPGSRSQYRGVYWSAQRSKWIAKAVMDKRQIYIGLFADEHEAGRAVRAWRIANMPYATDDLEAAL